MDNLQNKILCGLLNSSSDEDPDIFETFFDDTSSSEDSAEESEKHALTYNFLHVIDAYSEDDFKHHFRMQRSTIEPLILSYAKSGFSPNSIRGGKCRIGSRKEFYIYVWYICNTITFSELANLFGVPKSSAWTAVRRVCNWLMANRKEYIKWPQGDAVEHNCRKFEAKNKIPGVLGVINSTHIAIAAPKFNKECYYNPKHNFTVIMQAVVDANKKFIDICCGDPGSFHDSRVLRRSALYRIAEARYTQLFPSNTFLLGNLAYPVKKWLVPPYKDNGRLTEQHQAFNYLHSATRTGVENAFGLLKGRFRRLLKFTEQRDLSTVAKIVLSTCIMHNICITMNDEYSAEVSEEHIPTVDIKLEDSVADPTPNRRQTLFNELFEKNII